MLFAPRIWIRGYNFSGFFIRFSAIISRIFALLFFMNCATIKTCFWNHKQQEKGMLNFSSLMKEPRLKISWIRMKIFPDPASVLEKGQLP
jgi:3-isopropylmalate dehydratase small subunit